MSPIPHKYAQLYVFKGVLPQSHEQVLAADKVLQLPFEL